MRHVNYGYNPPPKNAKRLVKTTAVPPKKIEKTLVIKILKGLK